MPCSIGAYKTKASGAKGEKCRFLDQSKDYFRFQERRKLAKLIMKNNTLGSSFTYPLVAIVYQCFFFFFFF